jgi:hypothetical protein
MAVNATKNDSKQAPNQHGMQASNTPKRHKPYKSNMLAMLKKEVPKLAVQR